MSYRFWSHFRICVFGLAILTGAVLFVHGLLQLFGWQGLWEARDRYPSRAMVFFDPDGVRIFKRLTYVVTGMTLVWFPLSAIREALRDD